MPKFAEKNFPDFYNHKEFHAAVTHWMQTPKTCPPLMPEKLFQKLPGLFIENSEMINDLKNL